MRFFKKKHDQGEKKTQAEKHAKRRKKKLIKLILCLSLVGAFVLAFKNRRLIAAMIIAKKLPENKRDNFFVKLLLRKLRKKRR